MRSVTALALFLIWPTFAEAARCPHGQVFLVHKHECLSRAEFRNAMHHRPYHVAQATPPAPPPAQHWQAHCDPAGPGMCGDPIATEIDNSTSLPDAFGRSIMRLIPPSWKP
jgi:hypothetical protein